MTERAKWLKVTLVSDNGTVQIFTVKGGEAIHYITSYPGGDKGGSANCKHLIAVRNFLERKNGQAQSIQATVYDETREEDYDEGLSVGVSAVG